MIVSTPYRKIKNELPQRIPVGNNRFQPLTGRSKTTSWRLSIAMDTVSTPYRKIKNP